MRVALNDGPVHKCAGVALIGVADEVFFLTLGIARGIPFEPCREARAAAPGKSRCLDLLNDRFRRHIEKRAADSRVAARVFIFFDAFWIDHAAVAQSDARLLL